MPKTLDDIPAELKVLIAEHLEPHDILNTRLLSRELAAATEDCFLKTFFTTRRHAVTQHSLKILVKITSDARLRRGLQEIDLVVLDFEGHWRPDPTRRHIVADPWRLRDAEKCLEEFELKKAVWGRWRNESHALWEEHGALDLFIEALSNLKAAEITPHLRASGRYGQPVLAFGVNSLLRKLGLADCAQPGTSNSACSVLRQISGIQSRASEVLLEAIDATDFQPICLTASGEDLPCSLWALRSFSGHSLTRLRKLRLTLSNMIDDDYVHCISKPISYAACLERLDLTFLPWDQGYGGVHVLPRKFAAAFGHCSIKSLSITGGNFSEESLRIWPVQHSTALTKLVIDGVSLWNSTTDPGSDIPGLWGELFEEFGKVEHLEHITLKDLKEGKASTMIEGPGANGAFVFNGVERVRAGMQELLLMDPFEDEP